MEVKVKVQSMGNWFKVDSVMDKRFLGLSNADKAD